MSRPQHIQRQLDSMSNEHKFERTSRVSFSERGTLVQTFDDWYVTQNEYPHNGRGDDQLVIRRKRGHWHNTQSTHGSGELEKIMKEYRLKGYNIIIHSQQNQSSQFRTHFHMFK